MPKGSDVGARPGEETNTDHENGEAMASVGARVRLTAQLGNADCHPNGNTGSSLYFLSRLERNIRLQPVC